MKKRSPEAEALKIYGEHLRGGCKLGSYLPGMAPKGTRCTCGLFKALRAAGVPVKEWYEASPTMNGRR